MIKRTVFGLVGVWMLLAGSLCRSAAQDLPVERYTDYPKFSKWLQKYWQFREDLLEITPSPSGKWLVITARGPYLYMAGQNLPSSCDLFLLDQKGRVRKLTFDAAGYDKVVWSPDEQRIATWSRQGITGRPFPDRPQGPVHMAVLVIEIATGKREKVFEEGSTDLNPSSYIGANVLLRWFSDSRSLLYGSDNPNGVYLLTIGGQKALRLFPASVFGFREDIHLVDWQDAEKGTLVIRRLPDDLNLLKKPETWKALPLVGNYHFPDQLVVAGYNKDGRWVGATLTCDSGKPYYIAFCLIDLATQKVLHASITNNEYYLSFEDSTERRLAFAKQSAPANKKRRYVTLKPNSGVPFSQFDWKTLKPIQFDPR